MRSPFTVSLSPAMILIKTITLVNNFYLTLRLNNEIELLKGAGWVHQSVRLAVD